MSLELFLKAYKESLIHARSQFPLDYLWSADFIPTVLERMKEAIINGTFNKDSHAFKLTCKKLNIKCTYKAINAYIKDGVI